MMMDTISIFHTLKMLLQFESLLKKETLQLKPECFFGLSLKLRSYEQLLKRQCKIGIAFDSIFICWKLFHSHSLLAISKFVFLNPISNILDISKFYQLIWKNCNDAELLLNFIIFFSVQLGTNLWFKQIWILKLLH